MNYEDVCINIRLFFLVLSFRSIGGTTSRVCFYHNIRICNFCLLGESMVRSSIVVYSKIPAMRGTTMAKRFNGDYEACVKTPSTANVVWVVTFLYKFLLITAFFCSEEYTRSLVD